MNMAFITVFQSQLVLLMKYTGYILVPLAYTHFGEGLILHFQVTYYRLEYFSLSHIVFG